MPDHDLTKVYNEALRKLETADAVHAEVLNPLFEQLINNDAAHASSLAEIVTDLKLTDGADCTSIIQAALNKKGWVRIVSPGTFIVGRLEIDDDTKFELSPGVILKKKDGTNHYILVNRGHVLGYRNKNITIKGGKWDLNKAGNLNDAGDLSTNPQSWSGIGVLFNKVDNLRIEDIEEIGGDWKYCYLITDCDQVHINNVNLVNESDGLHFQPPLKNVFIENIRGVTHDDLISFTMGDYPRFSLGQTGNINNVVVRNVYVDGTTDQIIKMVGSGLDGKSVFKNMKFENLSGSVELYGIYIMKEDQASPNPCLKDTKLENIVFENIDIKVKDMNSYFCVGAASGDITIKKLKIRQQDTLRPMYFNKAVLDKVVIEDITCTDDSSQRDINYFIRVSGDSKINNLHVDKWEVKAYPVNSNAFFNISNGAVLNLFINNSRFDLKNLSFLYFDGTNAQTTNVYISNINLSNSIFAGASIPVNILINNSFITNSIRALQMNDGSNIRVSGNAKFTPALNINGLTVNRILSLNGNFASSVIPSQLTPQEDDTYYYSSATDVRNKGTYKYTGARWVKLNGLKEFDTNISVGTLNANSTVEFNVAVLDVSAYAMVFANPTFALPTGVVYSITLRNAGTARLRLSNPTTSAIVFDPSTMVAWKVKTLDFDYQ